jgi:hypothetical protein
VNDAHAGSGRCTILAEGIDGEFFATASDPTSKEVNMIRKTIVLLAVAALPLVGCGASDTPTASSVSRASVPATNETGTVSGQTAGGRPGSTGVVFVTSQGLYFDTFVTVDPLPMHGPFQLLVDGRTEFGPGDPGYVGGRWWEDLNGNGIQDQGDHFFHCPLLPPGRPTP